MFNEQVIILCSNNFCGDELSRLCRAVFYYTNAVNIGGLSVKASPAETIRVNRINQAGQPACDSVFVSGKGDFLLGYHQFIKTLLFDLVRDLAGQLRSRSSGLGIKFEAAQRIKSCPLDKVHQLFELPVGFARKANDQSRSLHNIGHSKTQVLDQALELVLRIGPTHRFQNLIIYMLERDIQVMNDFIAVCDGID